jgi:hypothetical protein
MNGKLEVPNWHRKFGPRHCRRLRSVTTTNEASLHPFFRLLIGEISAKIPRVSTVQEISQAIEHLDVRDQMRLLHDLPAHLKIQPDDVAWLKVAEPAFEFWNNPEDAIYDEL